MTTIEIQANLLRAVQAVAQLSVKAKDIREMLHGVFVDPTNQALVSTNGHTLVKSPATITGVWNGADSLILDLSQAKIPAKASVAVITVNEDGSDIRLELPDTNIAPQLLSRIRAYKYVDWQRVIKAINGEQKAYKAIGFNPEYINVVGKVIGKHYVVGMEFYGTGDTPTMFKVLWSNEPELVHIVMPAKI